MGGEGGLNSKHEHLPKMSFCHSQTIIRNSLLLNIKENHKIILIHFKYCNGKNFNENRSYMDKTLSLNDK